MNVEQDSKYINLLTPNCKIWIENLNFYEFIKVSDLVIDLTKTPNSLVNEVISYGIPILKSNQNYSYKNFTYDFTFDLKKDCDTIERIIQNKLSNKIPLLSTDLSNEYCSFYSIISNK
jgi:E3 ubiquitin-protein ligase DOA10